MSLPAWDAELFAELQHLLARVVAQPTTSSVRRLFLKLEEARPWLETLTSLPGPSDADQRKAENDMTVTPSGASQKVGADVIKAVSLALSISQVLAATLALQAEERRARYPSRTTLEISVYTFHEWCSQMLDFTVELMRLTIGVEAEPGETFDSLRDWVADLLSSNMIDHILSQIDTHQSKIPQSSSDFMLNALRSEQLKLATLLLRISQGGFMGRGHLIKTIKWLKKADRVDPVVALVYGSYLSVIRPMDSLSEEDPRYSVSSRLQTELIQNLDDWSHDVKFLRLSASLVAQEQWTIPQLREASRLPYCLFYNNAARYENATAEVGFDSEHNMMEAINAGALRAVLDLVQLGDFITEAAQDLVDAIAQKKNFLRSLRNREEDSRRGQTAHFQEFLALAGAVYSRLPPDSAEHLWSDLAFTSAVLDSRSNSPALFSLLRAISRGSNCATRCFERLKDTRLQWQSLFKFYQHYFDIMPHLFEPIRSTRTPSLDPMSMEEAQICKGWTELLTTVIEASVVARNALLQARPLQQLFDFVNCDIPLDLKAVVLDAATAFLPEGSASAIEHYERVSFADPTTDRPMPPIGWIAKMELQEQETRSYVLSSAYVRFLTALLPVNNSRGLRALRRGATYILDRVLPRPELAEVALRFIEEAISALDLSSLESPTARAAAKALCETSGFLVLNRFLNEPQIFESAALALDRGTATLRVLKIYNTVLGSQLLFSDILLPLLNKPTATYSIDHYLLNHLSNIDVVALLVGEEDWQIAHTAIQILRRLAQSPIFGGSDTFRGYPTTVNRLAGLIDASDNSILIAQAFCRQLDADAVEETNDDQATPSSIKSAIMDLLIEGTSETGPNLAHFLLGFDFKAADFGLQDPRSPSSRLSCLHIIIRQLADDTFFDLNPKLAARYAQLVYQLFAHPTTGRVTMSYVAAVADLIPRQLDTLPLESSEPLTLLEYQRWTLAAASLSIYHRVIEADQLLGEPPLLLALLGNVALAYPQTTESRPLEHYANFDFDRFKRVDADWWDLDRLKPALGGGFPEEAEYILTRLASVNAATELSLAQGAFLTVWCETLKISLATSIRTLPQVRQEVVLYALLDGLFNNLSADLTPGIAEILCESILITLSVLVTLDNDTSPEQIALVLHNLVDAALLPGLSESCRGNIYAAISQHLQLIDNAVTSEDMPTLSPQDVRRIALGVLHARKDRFLALLCRDALDDRDVWKTECFALLGGIVSLCQTERDRQLLQPIRSSLPAFIRSIKDRDVALQSGQDNHAFWVYESNVAFLMTLASSQMGAQWLLEAGLFEILATCHFLAIQPSGSSSLSAEEALAHRSFVCALQLLSRTLSSLRESTSSGAGHAISFLNAHRETLLLVLRESEDEIGMTECRLIVSILAMVVHKVAVDDLRSPSGFGALQHGVLTLAARLMADPEEGEPAGEGKAIFGFLCKTTSGLKGGSGQPVLLLGSQRSEATKYLASAPSLPAAVRYLSRVAELDGQDTLRIGVIESLMLLIWRHLLFYGSDPRDPIRPNELLFSSTKASGVREIASELRDVLEDLDTQDDAYAGMILRRLQELTGGITAAGMT